MWTPFHLSHVRSAHRGDTNVVVTSGVTAVSVCGIVRTVSPSDKIEENAPLRIAAFPDLMAKEAIFAITSGRASKITSSTPMGQVTRSRISPSSSCVRSVGLPTKFVFVLSYRARQSSCTTHMLHKKNVNPSTHGSGT